MDTFDKFEISFIIENQENLKENIFDTLYRKTTIDSWWHKYLVAFAPKGIIDWRQVKNNLEFFVESKHWYMFCYQNTKNVLWSCFNVFLDHSCFDTQRMYSYSTGWMIFKESSTHPLILRNWCVEDQGNEME